MSRRAPALYRVSGLLRNVGTAVLVLLVIFLATAAYSAAHLRPEVGGHQNSSSISLDPNGTAVLTESVNLSNQGFYSISPLTVSLEISNATTGAILALGGSEPLTIAPGSNSSIPIQVWLPLAGGSSALVTQDEALVEHAWVNATYASIFVIQLSGGANYSWGAPFYGFTAVPGTPSLDPNNTVVVPVTVSFSNHASFPDTGTLEFAVVTSSGTTCSTGTIPIDVAGGSGMYETFNFYSPTSCDPSGGSIHSTYTGSGLDVTLPNEAIP
jgi:hypothetical protein